MNESKKKDIPKAFFVKKVELSKEERARIDKDCELYLRNQGILKEDELMKDLEKPYFER